MRGSWRGRHPGTEVRRRSGCPRMIRRCSSAEFCYTNSCRFRVGMWRSLVARCFGSRMSQVRILSSRPFSLMHAFVKRNRFYWVQMVDKSVHQAAIHATSSNVRPAFTCNAGREPLRGSTQALGPHEIVPADAHEPKPEIPYGILPLSLSFQNFGIILPVLQLAVEVDDDGAVVSKPAALEKAPEPAIASIEALLYGFRRPKPVDATKMPPVRSREC